MCHKRRHFNRVPHGDSCAFKCQPFQLFSTEIDLLNYSFWYCGRYCISLEMNLIRSNKFECQNKAQVPWEYRHEYVYLKTPAQHNTSKVRASFFYMSVTLTSLKLLCLRKMLHCESPFFSAAQSLCNTSWKWKWEWFKILMFHGLLSPTGRWAEKCSAQMKYQRCPHVIYSSCLQWVPLLTLFFYCLAGNYNKLLQMFVRKCKPRRLRVIPNSS